MAEKPTAIAKQIGGPSLDDVRDIHLPTEKGQTLVEQRLPLSLSGRYSSFAIGVDRSHVAFRGFLPRKTTPRVLYQAAVIAKLP
jgi:hypothetical protein